MDNIEKIFLLAIVVIVILSSIGVKGGPQRVGSLFYFVTCVDMSKIVFVFR